MDAFYHLCAAAKSVDLSVFDVCWLVFGFGAV